MLSTPIQIRFNDIDRIGHVNNNAYFAYYDLGKEHFLRHTIGVDYSRSDIVPVIANTNADFIHPVLYGHPICVETQVVRLGGKSFTLVQRIVRTDSGTLMSQCRTVMVCFSVSTQQSAPMPAEMRRLLEEEKTLSTQV